MSEVDTENVMSEVDTENVMSEVDTECLRTWRLTSKFKRSG